MTTQTMPSNLRLTVHPLVMRPNHKARLRYSFVFFKLGEAVLRFARQMPADVMTSCSAVCHIVLSAITAVNEYHQLEQILPITNAAIKVS